MTNEKGKEKRNYGLAMPRLSINLEARDKEGKLIKKTHVPANSWLSNFYQVLKMLLAPHLKYADLYIYGATATTNIWESFRSTNWDNHDGGKTEIGVGNSDTAFSRTQSELQGTSVFWADMEECTETSTEVTFRASILCTSALTVKEVGLRWDSVLRRTLETLANIMIERTVLDAVDQIDVPADGSVIATYVLTLPS
ncbi:MAG: hypothetical protein PF495_14695 [Spirochaetales bacterium]|jgi:hypothetical protein|nr:hypothetical protein [Spirochaetales bacterium]